MLYRDPNSTPSQPKTPPAPWSVRIVAAYRHGTDFRYDLEYCGLEAGRFDLRDYLQRKDRSSLETVPPFFVEIESRLPAGQIVPTPSPAASLPRIGGYRYWMAGLAGLWLVAAAWMALGNRRRRTQTAQAESPPSLAERLRPLVADAVNGRLSPDRQAELERLLLGYWRQRLGLEEADPVTALGAIRRHSEAGALLRHVEDWLHRPGGAGQVDIAPILAPYQELPNVSGPSATQSPQGSEPALAGGSRA